MCEMKNTACSLLSQISRFAYGIRRRDVPGNGEHGRAFLDDRSAYGRADDGLSLSRID
jgi:hypothetical protein